MTIIESLKGKVIVSSQAMPNEPFYDEKAMMALMQSVVNGGAAGLRVAGKRDVINATTFGIPVVGLTKPDKLPENWRSVVYITPGIKEVKELIEAEFEIDAEVNASLDFADMSSIRLKELQIMKEKDEYNAQICKLIKSIYFCEVHINEKQ